MSKNKSEKLPLDEIPSSELEVADLKDALPHNDAKGHARRTNEEACTKAEKKKATVPHQFIEKSLNEQKHSSSIRNNMDECPKEAEELPMRKLPLVEDSVKILLSMEKAFVFVLLFPMSYTCQI